MNTNKYEAVVEAARKIRHWHDAMNGEGMIVSSEAVRELWKALDELDNESRNKTWREHYSDKARKKGLDT